MRMGLCWTATRLANNAFCILATIWHKLKCAKDKKMSATCSTVATHEPLAHQLARPPIPTLSRSLSLGAHVWHILAPPPAMCQIFVVSCLQAGLYASFRLCHYFQFQFGLASCSSLFFSSHTWMNRGSGSCPRPTWLYLHLPGCFVHSNEVEICQQATEVGFSIKKKKTEKEEKHTHTHTHSSNCARRTHTTRRHC